MKRSLLYVTLVFAVACNEADTESSSVNAALVAQNNELSAKAASCESLSQADQNKLIAVEAKLAAKLGQGSGSGPFHPDHVVNTIEELAAYGCASSAQVLLADAQNVDASLSLGSDGILNISDSERMRTLLIALQVVAPHDLFYQSLLVKYANESRLIRDGGNGRSIQQEAGKLLQAEGTIYRPHLKGYLEQWNADFGNCSTQYIQADGSTGGFISNWDSYFASIAQLPANSAVRSQIANSGFFCDGYNGYATHGFAIANFNLGDFNQTASALVDFANAHRVRGSVVGALALDRLLNTTGTLLSEAQAGDAINLMLDQFLGGSGNAIFPEENVRKKAVAIVENICFVYRRKHAGINSASCVSALEYLRDETSKKDAGREVRLAALIALANAEMDQDVDPE